jgi:hypothetical protein
MARIRTIKPEFFKNEQLADLPMTARLLFIGLWTLSDKEGRLDDRPKRIKAELFPYDNLDCDKELTRLQSSGFIYRYEVGEMKVIQVINFTTHQRITGKESESESKFPPYSPEGKQQGNNGEANENQLGEQEGKGKEGKGKGMDGEISPSSISQDLEFTEDQRTSFLKFTNWIKENAPRVAKMKEPFTIRQYLSVTGKGYKTVEIQQLLCDMHNWADLLKKRESAYLTFINWKRREDGSK